MPIHHYIHPEFLSSLIEDPDDTQTASALALPSLMFVNTLENAVATACTNPIVWSSSTTAACPLVTHSLRLVFCVTVITAEDTASEKQFAAALATSLVDSENAREVAWAIESAVALPYAEPLAQPKLPGVTFTTNT